MSSHGLIFVTSGIFSERAQNHQCHHPCLQVLVIVAASHLDAVTFQICSQSFKIMPTALFAVWLLGQYLTPMQWASLPVLAVGVVLVTMNGSAGELLLQCKLHQASMVHIGLTSTSCSSAVACRSLADLHCSALPAARAC